jgi:glycosyltransferase involved in cell wall biosynthesis
VRLIRRVRPDTVFSTLGHLNLLMILLKPLFPRGTRLFVRESSVVSELLEEPGQPWFFKYLYARLYPHADLIVCQSEGMRWDLAENFGIPGDRMVRIYNPVDCDRIRDDIVGSESPFQEEGEGPHIVSAGRLTREKGLDLLIRAFRDFRLAYPRARLWILGTGPLRESLEELCEKLDVAESVSFVGFRHDLHVWMKHADLFVLTSR